MIPILVAVLGLGLYLRHVNSVMKAVPPEAEKASPHRWTVEEVREGYQKALENPVDVNKSIPLKQARRYVVVGGSGLVGGWIVSHLLARGEDPSAVRVLDLLSPTEDILSQGVSFVKTNITDELAVTTAFEQPWSESVTQLPLTVFHTAATIRPQDRFEMFLPLCSKVNIDGTRNVLNAARQSGASCFVSTSSGSISLHKLGFWVAPWAKLPKRAFQILSDEAKLPERHDEFFGNYAVTKVEAEQMVRAANDPSSNFRTGCIRPSNGIYGIGSDSSMTITGVYLRKQGSPTCVNLVKMSMPPLKKIPVTDKSCSWVRPVIQSFVNAENVSIAHLLYEQRLLEQSQPDSTLPHIGGQSFVVTDPNPAISFGDIYTLLETLSKTPVSFPTIAPVPLLLISYLIEIYSVVQYKYLPWLLPKIVGDLNQVQPSLFSISDVFCVADDTRAKKAPEDGGLGYNPPLTTLEGMCKQLVDWNAKAGKAIPVDKIGPVAVTENGVDVNLVSPEMKI